MLGGSRRCVVVPLPVNEKRRTRHSPPREPPRVADVLVIHRADWVRGRRSSKAALGFLVDHGKPSLDLQRPMIVAAIAFTTTIVAILQLAAS